MTMEGFYKYENGTLAFAQTGIYQPNATYLVSEHTNYAFPKTWESTVKANVWEPGVYGWVEI